MLLSNFSYYKIIGYSDLNFGECAGAIAKSP